MASQQPRILVVDDDPGMRQLLVDALDTRGPGYEVETKHLFGAWKSWCVEQGREHPGMLQTFGRDLRAAVPGLKTSQARDVAGGRYRLYEGIKLV